MIMQPIEANVAPMKYWEGTVKRKNIEARMAMKPLTKSGPPVSGVFLDNHHTFG
jgi:hypothetical protein